MFIGEIVRQNKAERPRWHYAIWIDSQTCPEVTCGCRSHREYLHALPQDAGDFAEFAKTPLTMPMLVLAGEKASGTFLIDQARLVDTHVQGVIVKGSGHWLMEEAPGRTMAAIVQFIDAPEPK